MKNCKFSIINLKEKLNKMLETENTNAERVLELSQELDKLILEYYYSNIRSATSLKRLTIRH